MEELGTKLRLAYYAASDGPRVMIFGPCGADFRSLQQLFERLSHSPTQSYKLHEQAFIAAFGGVEITLSCSGPLFSPTSNSRSNFCQTSGSREPVFEWLRSAEGWDYLAALIDSLVQATEPGHQYLTGFPSEDAIVVVSKGEYGDDVLKE